MRNIMVPNWKQLYRALILALLGMPGLGTFVQISWTGRVLAGHRITFTCSSPCFPNCIYTWTFKGRTINGNTLTWTPDGLEDSVELQCTVRNPKTGISSTTINILEIKNEMFVQTSPPNTVPSVNQPLNVVCHGASSGDPEGPSDLIWYKDGQKVTLRENMQLQQNNLTLHFDSLLPSDAGFYQCETYLPTLQIHVFSLGYLLSFDPWKVNISGPDAVFPGRLSQFTCLTSCTLNTECTVRWEFRGGFPMGTFLSAHVNHLRWTPSTPGTFQNFTCIAENPAAGRSAEATKMVEVKGDSLSGSAAERPSGLDSLIFIVGLLFLFDW
ncbi:carcinoembryonic antigen-related cell adhesion molecule 20-like [Cololabis saira]|uniref:carcinoembryonic antigen-related cell adhesion molecule 20-like n=1 Tax=Cololabis saira TaxID=129043 RepID=UPI002AD41174|nr:carcinoembryonic antigen-related cell adhesion molecule 20-like [Cololabis saira]